MVPFLPSQQGCPIRVRTTASATHATAFPLMGTLERPFREIRAVHDADTVRVYQAYSDKIADLAVSANSFRAPLAAGCWSATRMTWIKPSAVWMAYRCGWTTMKDRGQARVLALDLSRSRFEELLRGAKLAHDDGEGCKASQVVVQWDPEREMDPAANGARDARTRGTTNVRSIQIGLRGDAVQALLDPAFVLRISDVTSSFRQASALLAAGDESGARAALWPETPEAPMVVPVDLRAVLKMDEEAPVPSPAPAAAPRTGPSAEEATTPPETVIQTPQQPLNATPLRRRPIAW